jgi:protein-tyrosine phosphatase
MGFNHQDFLRETFNREVRLFNEVCFQKREPILDLHEALPNWQSDLKASRAYVLSVIDYIFTAMPAFVTALHALERRGHTLPD